MNLTAKATKVGIAAALAGAGIITAAGIAFSAVGASASSSTPVRPGVTSTQSATTDDRGTHAEPGDDRGTHAEPGDDRGTHVEPGDDRGNHAEPGDDKGSNR